MIRRGLLVGLLTLALMLPGCKTVQGVIDLAQDAAPAGGGAMVGLLISTNPFAAAAGAMIGVAVSQAIDGQIRAEEQNRAVDDLIRGGGSAPEPRGFFGELAQLAGAFTEFVVAVAVLLFLLGLVLPSPIAKGARPRVLIGKILGKLGLRAPTPARPPAPAPEPPPPPA